MNRKRDEVSMGLVCSEIDRSVMMNLNLECLKVNTEDGNREELDQEFKLEDALRLLMLDADKVLTKRMEKRKKSKRLSPSPPETPRFSHHHPLRLLKLNLLDN